MKVSLKWLRDYVDITLSPPEPAGRLTVAGVEGGGLTSSASGWEGVTVAQVVDVARHPNADRLVLATVDLGGGQRQTVVCGAPNVAVGQKVPFAPAGTRLIDGHTGKPTVLRPAVIRGVEAAGMICAEKELGPSAHAERAPVGVPLASFLADVVFDLDLTPNRPDLLSVVGVAREVAALTGQPLREPSLEYREDGPPTQ